VKIRAAPPRVATKPQRLRPAAKVRAAVYGTPLHRAWAAAVIARSGGMCQGIGCPNPFSGGRLFADHIRELKDGGGFDLANGVALCGSCHTRKTLAARALRVAGKWQ
jgi:5-methylcytosine-specific restriction enzyme A